MLYMYLALTVYTRSPAAYEALHNFRLVQLPSVRFLKYFIDANLEDVGDSRARLVQSEELSYNGRREDIGGEKD